MPCGDSRPFDKLRPGSQLSKFKSQTPASSQSYESFSALSGFFSANSAVKSFSWLNFKLQFHPVIRKLHIRRQTRVRLLVRQVMTDVSEERASRFQPLHCLQRILNRRM